MCIYTVKRNFKKKILSNVPKLGVSGVKGTEKLTKF